VESLTDLHREIGRKACQDCNAGQLRPEAEVFVPNMANPSKNVQFVILIVLLALSWSRNRPRSASNS